MLHRRGFLVGSIASAVMESSRMSLALANPSLPRITSALGAIRKVQAGVLEVGYHELGPRTGTTVLLLHGFPYDVHSYIEAAPLLAARGLRVIIPYLRGHGPTRFLEGSTPRSGQQAAIGLDVIALLDALTIPSAVLAGYDWGARAACIVAALWPKRCDGLVSVNGYLIQDIAHAETPLPAVVEAGLWYQFYFLTERGHAGLTAHRRDIARILWARNSPKWHFDDAVFDRSAQAFDNPDYVDVVLHSYRHRLGMAAGFEQYAETERQLAFLPAIRVPSLTLDGGEDGVVPASNGEAAAGRFAAWRQHRVIANAGHNLPQEDPIAFCTAVLDIVNHIGHQL